MSEKLSNIFFAVIAGAFVTCAAAGFLWIMTSADLFGFVAFVIVCAVIAALIYRRLYK